jgi:hypothetical protein
MTPTESLQKKPYLKNYGATRALFNGRIMVSGDRELIYSFFDPPKNT